MKAFILITGLVLTTSVFCKESCDYVYDANNTKVSFVAFKTLKKLGVKVGFDKFVITTKEKFSKDPIGVINDAEFKIDVSSLNSGDPKRDEKLKSIFFRKGKKTIDISGKVLDIKNEFITTEINIGGIKKQVPLKYNLKDTTLEASGTIDMLDFNLNKNISAINMACNELHEGKTWSDVNITIESQLIKSCH